MDQQPPVDPSMAGPLKKIMKRSELIKTPVMEKLKEIMKEAKQIQEEESDDEIPYPESEMLDAIVRTRKATQLVISMLPKLDKVSENRLARATEPIPEILPK